MAVIRIVFGIRHFTIKSYEPAEFGLTDASWKNTKFEFVKKYFHLMYIPMFPVGSMIGTRGADGQLYHLNPSMASHIDKYEVKHKSPWYLFLGPILAGLALIIFAINGTIQDRKNARWEENKLLNYKTTVSGMISHPSLYDYYRFAIDTDATDGESSYQIYAVYQVIGFTDKAIRFRSAVENPFDYSSDPDYGGWLFAFKDTISHNAFWLDKTDLKNAMGPAAKDVYSLADAKMTVFGKERYMRIADAHVIDGPDFQAYYREIASSGIARIRVENKGDSAKSISFMVLSGKGTWGMEDANVILPGGYFELKTETGIPENFSFRIDCFGMDERKHQFIFTQDPDEEMELSVRKIK